MMRQILEQLTPRTLALGLVSITGLTLLASYFYLIKAPLKFYTVSRETVTELAADPQFDARWDMKIEQLESDIEQLDRQLYGQGPRLPVNQMVAYVIGQLDLAAGRRKVTLISVRPAPISQIFVFDGVPFDIEVKGDYFDLVTWLRDVEHYLGAMVVKRFEITPGSAVGERHMQLTMESYRPTGDG